MNLKELVQEIFRIIDALPWEDEAAEIEALITKYVEDEISGRLLNERQ